MGDAAQPGASYVYWVNAGGSHRIQRAKPVQDPTAEDIVEQQGGNPYGLAVDVEGGWVYWVQTGNQTSHFPTIFRTPLDGQSPLVLLEPPHLIAPKALALDAAANVLYWTDFRDFLNSCGSVLSGLIDGDVIVPESISVLYTESGFCEPGSDLTLLGLAVDPSAGYVFHSNTITNKITRTNLADNSWVQLDMGPLADPKGIALDPVTQSIYWVELGVLKRNQYDGGTFFLEVVAVDPMTSPQDVALDLDGRMVYWTDAGTDQVFRKSLAASSSVDPETFVTGLSTPRGIAVAHPPSP